MSYFENGIVGRVLQKSRSSRGAGVEATVV